jgi:hypothetical protein
MTVVDFLQGFRRQIFQQGASIHQKGVAQRCTLARIVQRGAETPVCQSLRNAGVGCLYRCFSEDFFR